MGESSARSAFLQVLSGVRYCHRKRVVHRDLKPDNFLVYSLAATPPHVCISDFGLAAVHPPDAPPLTEVVGSAYFLAPEVLRRSYGPACDCWSLGVNLFLLLSGRVPFGGGAARSAGVYEAILRAPLDFPAAEWAGVSPLAKELVSGLLEKDPARRYTVRDALAHPWLSAAGRGGVEAPLGLDIVRSMLAFTSVNRLRAMALHTVANSLTAAEAARMRAQFFSLDLNSDSGISPAELAAALGAMGHDLAAGELAKLVAALDADGDGKVNLGEFLAATSELALLQHKGSAMRAFARFDVNGDGLIDLAEARAVLAEAERARAAASGGGGGGAGAGESGESDGGEEDEKLRELMAQYGKGRGGATSTLSFDDFWEMLCPGVPVPEDSGTTEGLALMRMGL